MLLGGLCYTVIGVDLPDEGEAKGGQCLTMLPAVLLTFYLYLYLKTWKTRYSAKAIDTYSHHSKQPDRSNQKTKICTNMP